MGLKKDYKSKCKFCGKSPIRIKYGYKDKCMACGKEQRKKMWITII